MDTLFVAFIVLISKDPSSLNELAQQAPGGADPKGKGRASSGNLVDILFSLLNVTSSKGDDPLSLAAPGSDYTDAELRVAGIGKKEKLTVRLVDHFALSEYPLILLVADGDHTFDSQ